MSHDLSGGGGALKLDHHSVPVREVKRVRTSIDGGKRSSAVDVDAIVDEVLRDDVEQFELRSTPERHGETIQTEINSNLSDTSGQQHEMSFEVEGEGEYYYYSEDGDDHHEAARNRQLGTDASDSEDNDEVSALLQSSNEIIQQIMTLGPNLFVRQQIDGGRSPEKFLEALDFPLPDSLVNAEFVGKWLYVKRLLMKHVYERPRLGLSTMQDVVDLLARSRKIMIITGAGISVSCGIPDFRSENGLYTKIQEKYALPEPECMFDIEFFRIDPEPFYSFARELLPSEEFNPSFSHHFIADLERRGQLIRQYTQNIDTLEEDAGIKRVVYCHGSFASASCLDCRRSFSYEQFKAMIQTENVPYCDYCSGVIKPDIVFFGEPLPKTFDDHLEIDCQETDLVLVIGSSMKVHPVSAIPDLIPPNVPQILINRESLDHNFDIELLGDCDTILAELQRLLSRSFEDPVLQERFSKMGKEAVASRFIEPIYHIFPGAKSVNSSNELPRSAPGSPVSSEALVGDPADNELSVEGENEDCDGNKGDSAMLPDDSTAFTLSTIETTVQGDSIGLPEADDDLVLNVNNVFS